MAIGWTSVHRDSRTGKYQLWYQAYSGGRDARKTHKCVVAYAESDDGVSFVKPTLGIHDFNTERNPWNRKFDDTNIVLLGDGGYGDRYGCSVLFDQHEPNPGQRYKMLYTDFYGIESNSSLYKPPPSLQSLEWERVKSRVKINIP